MSKKSFWNEIGDFIRILLFIKYVLPLLIIIIVGIFIYNNIYVSKIEKEYANNDKIIVSSKLNDTVYSYALDLYDRKVFSEINKGDTHLTGIKGKVEYIFSENSMDVGWLNTTIKSECSKMFYKLQNKTIKNNQPFSNKQQIWIDLVFFMKNESGEKIEICDCRINYIEDKGFSEDDYSRIMNANLINEKELIERLNKSN